MLLLKETIDSLSNNKETFTGIATDESILKLCGSPDVGLLCKNKVTAASAEA